MPVSSLQRKCVASRDIGHAAGKRGCYWKQDLWHLGLPNLGAWECLGVRAWVRKQMKRVCGPHAMGTPNGYKFTLQLT